jgi:hypothetical protein
MRRAQTDRIVVAVRQSPADRAYVIGRFAKVIGRFRTNRTLSGAERNDRIWSASTARRRSINGSYAYLFPQKRSGQLSTIFRHGGSRPKSRRLPSRCAIQRGDGLF